MTTISIQQAVNNFKNLIEQSIEEGGTEAKQAMIRSSRPILNIHDAIKAALIIRGVNPDLINPPLFERKPELKLAGSLKQKDQDVCVVPNHISKRHEILQYGLLNGVEDEYGEDYTKQILTINVRSQISSIQKNFDTLYERTISEAQNLHDRCPNMVLGEVYLIAVPEYDDSCFDNYSASFKNINQDIVEKYIKSFLAITNRNDITKDFYQYESTCLLIVDFNRVEPKIYSSTQELKNDGLLSPDSEVSYEELEWNNFLSKILNVYNNRFGIDKLR